MFITLFILGLIIGVVSALLGIGGGALIVPTLLTLYPELPVQNVVATSLAFIFFNSIITNLQYYHSPLKIDYKKSMHLNTLAVLGGVLGGSISLGISQKSFTFAFSLVLVVIAFRVFFTKSKSLEGDEITSPNSKFWFTGFVGGILSSITGLGGGAIFVPLLISFAKIPIIFVSPYSNMAMSFATMSGLIPHMVANTNMDWTQNPLLRFFQIGNVSFLFPLVILSGSLITSRYGVHLNMLLKAKTKKYIFSCLLIILALKTFLS